jgi:hypothetical protein
VRAQWCEYPENAWSRTRSRTRIENWTWKFGLSGTVGVLEGMTFDVGSSENETGAFTCTQGARNPLFEKQEVGSGIGGSGMREGNDEKEDDETIVKGFKPEQAW